MASRHVRWNRRRGTGIALADPAVVGTVSEPDSFIRQHAGLIDMSGEAPPGEPAVVGGG